MSQNDKSVDAQADKQADKAVKVTVLTIVGSLFAGWFGVQSNKNRERDFTHGKASTFVFAGIIFAALFVLFVWGLVQLVLALAQ